MYREGVQRIIGLKRIKMTFRYIVTCTVDVSVGPLEYCGSAIPVRSRRGQPFTYVHLSAKNMHSTYIPTSFCSILATRHDPDPSKKLSLIHRLIRHRQRVSRGPTVAKAKMSDAQHKAIKTECSKATALRAVSTNTPKNTELSMHVKAKKRKSADEGISEQDRLASPVKRQRRSAGIVMYGYPAIDKALHDLKCI